LGIDLVQSIVSFFSYLKKLKLNGCRRVTDAGLLLVSKRLKVLQHLEMNGCEYLTDKSLIPLFQAHGTQLISIQLSKCNKITNKSIKELLIKYPKQLEELDISECIEITDDAIEFFSSIPSFYGNRVASSYDFMKKINLSGCILITSLSVCWIIASCPLLVSFQAAKCEKLCDKALVALGMLEKLEELDLSGCTRLCDA
jgi:hypothetical protein